MKSHRDRWVYILILFVSVHNSHQASWTAWEKSSSCSRSCGGGVKIRERLCVEDGTSRKCKGRRFSYRLCNTQECEDQRDFREAQCEEHNATPLDGVLYKWKPYYGHGQTCELLCFAEGFEFFHKLADKVIDGTSCHSDGHHICVNGSCKSVGCDQKIGSKLRLDACGVCGGDNSSCVPSNEVTGTFDISNLSPGFTTVLEIPLGARNIFISDQGENRNPLVFWDSARNTLTVDETTRKSLKSNSFAGTTFIYTSDEYVSGRGRLTAAGPIDRSITLYIVNKGHPNRGIKYGYTLPQKSDKVASLDLQPKVNIRLNKESQEIPSRTRTSAVNYYLEQPEKSTIQVAATKVRVVEPSRPRERVPERISRPDFSYLHGNSQRYSWSYGHWAPCSNGCGTGIQRRVVSCIDRVERKPTDPSSCDPNIRPSPSQSCTNTACRANAPGSYVQWKPGLWGPCSTTCELGVQTQQVTCEAVFNDGTTRAVDDERCLNQYRSKPQYRRSCNDGVPCDRRRPRDRPIWRVSRWSQCSVTCGRGQQSRRVDCRSSFNPRRILPDWNCVPELRPVNLKLCVERRCPPSEIRRRRPLRTCQNTYYGCCWDGYTAARGPNNMGCPRENIKITEDDAKVKATLPQLKCQQPAKQGNCQDYVVRWYYNSSTCTRFWYGGCNGNDNNFETEEECQRDCPGYFSEDVCKLPSFTGRCKARHRRWYYNYAQRECQEFIYGGCGGNANRFRTKADCERQCLSGTKALGDERVLCESSRYGCCPDGITVALGNNNEGCPNSCQSTVYGCCDDEITAAQGPNQEGCEEIEISSGEGAECDQSTYGCCPDGVTAATGPNDEGCYRVVIGKPDEVDIVPTVAAQCRQPSEFGTCRDDMKVMWFYNTTSRRCQRFWYGGCGGNDNRFKSEKECLTTCTSGIQRGVSVKGSQYVDLGASLQLTCTATGSENLVENIEADWFKDGDKLTTSYSDGISIQHQLSASSETYTSSLIIKRARMTDSGTYVCRVANKVSSIRVVVRDVPDTTTPVCQQPKEVGPCFALIPRWYHNPETRKCEQFEYGGCRGNQNNFASQYECENYCGVRRGIPISKPGECLAVDFGDNCYSSCQYDGDCPGNEKCCADRNSCYRCVQPGRRTDVVVTVPSEVCNQPKDTGPCRAAMPRYYYNPETQLCEQFTYGGCEGNKNNFETEETCRRYCRARAPAQTRTRQPVCELTPDYGPCRSPVSKFHYNITTLQCEPFTYGGCLGNHNNFETEAKCMAYCGLRHGTARRDDCLLQKEVGNCRANIPRWHYDARVGRCYEFGYGGCQGNGNNFPDETTCYDACRDVRAVVEPERTRAPPPIRVPVTRAPTVEGDLCSLPLETPCDNSEGGVKWYYDHDMGVCKEVPDGGCNNNRNNFQSREQCEAYCSRERVCRPLYYTSDVRCLALIPRWTYDRETGDCQEFSYGGCGGSSNNFVSYEACSRKCGARITRVTEAPEPTSPDEICALPEDPGNCLAYIRNWRYDSSDGTCKEFTYGGCGGNKNNFGTREECERFCTRDAVCREFDEPEVGCLAYMPRWRYVPSVGQCENFIYGGCGGNANNFETFEACERKCITPVRVRPDEDNRVDRTRATTWMDICNKQADVGPCKQYIKRWYYNSITRDCEEFTYGGCVGNHNNFESRMQCMTYCDSSRFREPSEPEPTETDIYIGSGEIPDEVEGIGVCALANETGACEAYIPSYYYDHLTGDCRQFVWGGCGGNKNRFTSREDCEAQCSPQEICRLPQVSGRCMAYKPRFFFDYNAGFCREFVYGGCEGNANNFVSLEACERRCSLYMNRVPDDRRVKPGYCPPRSDWVGLLGACAPQCQYDSDCPDRQKCCHQGCGLRCIDPLTYEPYQIKKPLNVRAQTISDSSVYLVWYDQSLERDQLIRDGRFYTVRYYSYDLGGYEYLNVTEHRSMVSDLQPDTEYNFEVRVMNPPYLSEWSEPAKNRTMARRERVRPGYCPARTDWEGLLGACAAQCSDDSECEGRQKCCHHGCGLKCVDPITYEPYQMDKPIRVQAHTMSDTSIHLAWYDSSLGRDQIIQDDRMYTVRYYSYDLGRYEYMNMTELRGTINGLRPDTEYNFEVRSMNPPYLSEWSEPARNRTAGRRERVKPGYCPVKEDRQGLLGACAPLCQYDSDCEDRQKCCYQGCGLRCVEALSYEPYQMDRPINLRAHPLSDSSMHIRWYDPSPERDQNNHFYTVRYYNYDQGQYQYINVTDQQVNINGLQADTDYYFEVRSMNPPYRSEWSEQARNRTSAERVLTVKSGECPRMEQGSVGLCFEECRNDVDCAGDTKCCSNGCGHVCMNPAGYDICRLDTDRGSCSNWEVRWFFNYTLQRCDRFWYGGCNEGNANNFVDEDSCLARCGPAPITTTPRSYDCRRSVYGCCSDNYTPRRDQWGSNCPGYEVRGCRYGEVCGTIAGLPCPPGYNCISLDPDVADTEGVCCAPDYTTPEPRPYDCRRSIYGCCNDSYTPRIDRYGSNCPGKEPGDVRVVPVTPGRSATLNCNYGSSGDYDIVWYREGKLLETDEKRTVYPNGTLVVRQTTIEDDGSYACHVRFPGRQIPDIYRYNIQVLIPIGILPGPDTIMVKPNHMAFLHCEVYGNPKPTVSWRKNTVPIMADGKYEMFRNGTLLIRQASEDDIASYTCEADNRVSQPVQRSLKLNLREMLVARIENNNGRVIEGGRITLRCEGRGYPTPTLIWEKMGRPLATGGNVYISSDGRLVIRDATLDDTGTYSCIVSNSEEKIETSTSVQVVPKAVMPEKCEDKTSLMKCRLIVTANLCGYRMYSKICCNSCSNYYRDA